MTREQIREAAYSLINNLERGANAHDLIVFTIQHVNAALEEAANSMRGTNSFSHSEHIRSLKVKP